MFPVDLDLGRWKLAGRSPTFGMVIGPSSLQDSTLDILGAAGAWLHGDPHFATIWQLLYPPCQPL